MRPKKRTIAAVAVSAAAIAVAAVSLGPTLGGGEETSTGRTPTGPLSAVERRDLTRTTSASGTLGYRGRETVVCRRSGTVTWLARAGSTVGRGETLLEVDERPSILFFGPLPAYRTLESGVADGDDVRQLEKNLLALGYDPYGAMTIDGEFTDASEAAVERWQDDLGLKSTGRVELGDVVFLSGPQRVSQLDVGLGAAVGGDSAPGGASSTTVMTTNTTERSVSVELDATEQGLARVGARVSVRLPDGSTTPGRVSHVSKVASGAGGEGDEEDSGTTIPVAVELDQSGGKVARYDQAPVSVTFTEVIRKDVLAVPVTAITALPGGGYAVQAVREGRVRTLPVKTGSFANGFVEISGKGIRPGLRVEDAG
ncbi:MAG: peptidoglycan-binding protein [Actinomycetota bacterium]|nr:peptidoglycan-binding protein [Actinomycetota bacterium]